MIRCLANLILFMIVSLTFGCATGDLKYIPPTANIAPTNSTIVTKNKDQLWRELIPELGKQFFVINNVDKDSGLINISYSGDPEAYVDCGRIVSHISIPRGDKHYDFPASRAYQEFESIEKGQYFMVKRKMDLEGRINIIIQDTGVSTTLMTVNTKYILTKKINTFDPMGRQLTSDDEVLSFNSNQEAAFSRGKTACRPTGKFEQDILGMVLK